MSIIKKGILATTLAASALTASAPAMARDYYHRDHDNTAGVAIGAGIIGLAIGAIAASSSHRDRYDDRYYADNGGYYNNGYYYDRSGRNYSRDEWRRRYDNRYYDNRRDRDGWDRDQYYSRRGY
jgi:hypothetical protein